MLIELAWLVREGALVEELLQVLVRDRIESGCLWLVVDLHLIEIDEITEGLVAIVVVVGVFNRLALVEVSKEEDLDVWIPVLEEENVTEVARVDHRNFIHNDVLDGAA